MSSGGHSWHKKDWLNNVIIPAAVIGTAGVGLGAAGIGPMAGLFGESAAGAGMGLGEAAGAGLGFGLNLAPEVGAAAGASAFGAPAAGSAMLSSFAPEATPFITGGGLDSAAATFGSAFGPTASQASMLTALDPLADSPLLTGSINSDNPGILSQLQGFMANRTDRQRALMGLLGQSLRQQSQPPVPMQPAHPPGGQYQGGNELSQLSQLFSNPAGQEALKRILRAQGISA